MLNVAEAVPNRLGHRPAVVNESVSAIVSRILNLEDWACALFYITVSLSLSFKLWRHALLRPCPGWRNVGFSAKSRDF